MKNILITLTLLLLISCEKLIEVDNPNNQIDKNEVFSNLQTANSALAALYADMMVNSPISGVNLDAALSLYTDELDEYSTTVTPNKELFLNQQIDTNLVVYNIWANAYKQIYSANSIIEGVESSTGIAPNDKKYLIGEALLIRTLIFYYLNQVYGDIPYPVTTDYKLNQVLGKTASAEVLSKMENDLARVLVLLQDDYRNAERIYPNKMAARLLLAKIYMSQQNWTEAETLLNTIKQSSLYQIQNDVTKVFQKSGKHILWQLKPANNKSLPQATTYYFTNVKPYLYALSPALISSFQDSDLRKQNWMGKVTVSGQTWYRAEKYKNRDNTNANEYSIIFRQEEVYLLLAETLVQQNKLAEALPNINVIRQRSGLPPLSISTKETMLDEILLEDKREFFTETGHRFLDLKRIGKLNTLLSVKPNWKDFHKLWPIPQKEILLNTNLQPQNQGY